jgi:hypothetical protein
MYGRMLRSSDVFCSAVSGCVDYSEDHDAQPESLPPYSIALFILKLKPERKIAHNEKPTNLVNLINYLKLINILYAFVAMFYFTLGSISPQHRSSLHEEYLFVNYNKILRVNKINYGADIILESFMEDLCTLEKTI